MVRRSSRFNAVVAAVLIAAALASPRAVRADEPLPLVHPIYVHLPDAPEEDALRRAFTAAAARYKLHPVEVVDVPAPAAPRAPDLLKTGILNTTKIAFAEALRDLDAAAAEVASTAAPGCRPTSCRTFISTAPSPPPAPTGTRPPPRRPPTRARAPTPTICAPPR